jgi:hypothetical protein
VRIFNDFNPTQTKPITVMGDGTGLVGILADGRTIIARSKSTKDKATGTDGPPTLEIQSTSASGRIKYTKFRFENTNSETLKE